MARVLVIDDDPALLKALRLGLKAGGHDVVTAATGESGLTQAAAAAPDVVIVDLGLPDVDGIEVCRRIREWSSVPILVLSAVEEEKRKVSALDAGADDYVTKPFGMAELQARIRAALRRHSDSAGTASTPEIEAGPMRLDLVHHQAFLSGAPVDLTAKEFDVATYLARHAGRTCTHEMILAAVWGPGYGREASYLHAYVHRLRQKLGDADSQLIRTVPGIGYVFEPGT
ncbi:MAG TPA: response regulator transcription factor [Acidimicrobiales bacterium]|nr:response regulator transcription factor [Acidimicrobiales bacterium]